VKIRRVSPTKYRAAAKKIRALSPVRIDGKTEIELDNERRGSVIATETAVTRWQGERMDYGMATDGILRLDKESGYSGDTVQVHCGN